LPEADLLELETSLPLDYALQLSSLLRAPIYQGRGVMKGNGAPVLLIPGFLAGDWAMRTMAGWLRRIGYQPYLSGIDWNVAPPEVTMKLLRWRLSYVAHETDSAVFLVGHSLGGMLARVLAGECPALVSHVIALGSPIRDPLQAAHYFLRVAALGMQTVWGRHSALQNSNFFERVAAPLPPAVGFTAIFSKQDEVVDWRACVDPRCNNQQVSGKHLGLIVNPEVYRSLAYVLWATQQASRRDGRERIGR
jgi:triacylglycerol lipase